MGFQSAKNSCCQPCNIKVPQYRVRTMRTESCVQRRSDLQHALGQVPVILLGDLRAVGGSLKHGRVVVHILHMDHHCGVVLLQVVRGRQAQLVLSKTIKRTHTPLSDTYMKHSVNWHTPASSVHARQMPGAIYSSTDLYEITRNKLYECSNCNIQGSGS